jgi:hypothetical protein
MNLMPHQCKGSLSPLTASFRMSWVTRQVQRPAVQRLCSSFREIRAVAGANSAPVSRPRSPGTAQQPEGLTPSLLFADDEIRVARDGKYWIEGRTARSAVGDSPCMRVAERGFACQHVTQGKSITPVTVRWARRMGETAERSVVRAVPGWRVLATAAVMTAALLLGSGISAADIPASAPNPAPAEVDVAQSDQSFVTSPTLANRTTSQSHPNPDSPTPMVAGSVHRQPRRSTPLVLASGRESSCDSALGPKLAIRS